MLKFIKLFFRRKPKKVKVDSWKAHARERAEGFLRACDYHIGKDWKKDYSDELAEMGFD